MLCETGQRRNDRAPGSMVIELLRSVFTYVFCAISKSFVILNLNVYSIINECECVYVYFSQHSLPEPLEPAEKIEHRMYDEAHATIDNCQKLYPKCVESVWNSKYM